MIRRGEETVRVAATSTNLKGMNIKILRDAANFIAVGATELARRAVVVCGTEPTTVMDGWVAILEAENRTLRRENLRRPYEISTMKSFPL
jgi:hypothetical protein